MTVTFSGIPGSAASAARCALCKKEYTLAPEETEKGASKRTSTTHHRTGNVLLGNLSSHSTLIATITRIKIPP